MILPEAFISLHSCFLICREVEQFKIIATVSSEIIYQTQQTSHTENIELAT